MLDIHPDAATAYTLVGPGWRRLLDEAYEYGREVGMRPLQVKAKFGRLRVTWPVDLPKSEFGRAYTLSRSLEERSGHMCEVCGAEATLVEDPGKPRWKVTLCADHIDARRRGERWVDLMAYQPYTTPLDGENRLERLKP